MRKLHTGALPEHQQLPASIFVQSLGLEPPANRAMTVHHSRVIPIWNGGEKQDGLIAETRRLHDLLKASHSPIPEKAFRAMLRGQETLSCGTERISGWEENDPEIQKQEIEGCRLQGHDRLQSPEPRVPCEANRTSIPGDAPGDAEQPLDQRALAELRRNLGCCRTGWGPCGPARKPKVEGAHPRRSAAAPPKAPGRRARKMDEAFAEFAPGTQLNVTAVPLIPIAFNDPIFRPGPAGLRRGWACHWRTGD